MQEPQQTPNSFAWDPVVRSTHWSLVIFFSAAYWLGGDWLDLHAHIGYCVLLVVAVRSVWGAVGAVEAQFRHFVVSAPTVVRYLQSLRIARVPWERGHDPGGGWMIVALLVGLFVTGASGVVLFALEHRGPLAETFVTEWPGAWVEAVHHFASEAVIVLVLVHVLGVLFMSWYTRKNLVKPMIRPERLRNSLVDDE